MENFVLIKKEIENQLKKSEFDENAHSQLAWKWVLKQKPDADIPLQIAILAHDYERSFPDRERRENYESYEKYKQVHAEKSARMVASLMSKFNFPSDDIKKVEYLIKNHEVGGNDNDLQILTDSDSLSYFEGSVPWYRKTHSEEQTRDKIIFMYRRMSKGARKFIEQIKFEDKDLNELYQKTVSNL